MASPRNKRRSANGVINPEDCGQQPSGVSFQLDAAVLWRAALPSKPSYSYYLAAQP
jgi:hypothetical protein